MNKEHLLWLEEQVRDYEKELRDDTASIEAAKRDLEKTKLRYAQAIIDLHAYKNDQRL